GARLEESALVRGGYSYCLSSPTPPASRRSRRREEIFLSLVTWASARGLENGTTDTMKRFALVSDPGYKYVGPMGLEVWLAVLAKLGEYVLVAHTIPDHGAALAVVIFLAANSFRFKIRDQRII